MTREPEHKYLNGAIAVAAEALDHLQRGSVVSVKYHEGGAMETEGPASLVLKLEVEALDLPLRNKSAAPVAGATLNDNLLGQAVQDNRSAPVLTRRPMSESVFASADALKKAQADEIPAKSPGLDETTIRSILMGIFLDSTTLTIDRAVQKLLYAQDGLK